MTATGASSRSTLRPASCTVSALAELDTTKTHRFAKQAARYLKAHAGEKLPKSVLLTFE